MEFVLGLVKGKRVRGFKMMPRFWLEQLVISDSIYGNFKVGGRTGFRIRNYQVF